MNSVVKDSTEGTYGKYLAGYLLSLALTGTAFWLAHKHLSTHHLKPSDSFMLAALAALAITQLMVQVVFFLHLDRESKPRWNLTAAALAGIIVFILVAGSIWIMASLDYHHPGGHGGSGHDMSQETPAQVDRGIIQDEGIKP